ncbi:MAG: hypothetical protein AAFU69_02345 [Pseudomonadota bacterium]
MTLIFRNDTNQGDPNNSLTDDEIANAVQNLRDNDSTGIMDYAFDALVNDPKYDVEISIKDGAEVSGGPRFGP